MNIKFEKAAPKHVDIIFGWLNEPHMIEFWDNSQEHKDDLLNFIHGRKQHRYYGTTKYWVGIIDNEPFSFILSDILQPDQDLPDIYREHMSKLGRTVSIDFGIGNKKHLGRGLAAPTLDEFIKFYKTSIDPHTDTFFIDPDENNPRAEHVYNKAGFELVGKYTVTTGSFVGHINHLMVKKYEAK